MCLTNRPQSGIIKSVRAQCLHFFVNLLYLRHMFSKNDHAIPAPVSFPMVSVPGGNYFMGPKDSKREVHVDAFEIGETPITQAQWRYVATNLPRVEIDLPENPSHFTGDDLPVESVNWYQAMEFCNRLSTATGKTYTLPTEEQWEYACRAGTDTDYPWGDEFDNSKANCDSNSTSRVGSFPSNPWGLKDMNGNVYEWCLSDYEGS